MANNFLLDLLFPKRCVSCQKIGFYICQNCQKEIKFFENQICPICQHSSLFGATHVGCQTKCSLDGLFSLAYFTGPIRLAIHKLKYKFLSDLAEELVELMLSNKELAAMFEGMKINKFILIPVPLHPQREKWRGFNQAEVLAFEISKKTRIGFSNNFLERIKNTPPQVELKKGERLKNVGGAFEASSKRKVLGKKFLLVDDTTTTGATLRSCASALKKAGALEVWALTLARSAR
jgi:ComF family protein